MTHIFWFIACVSYKRVSFVTMDVHWVYEWMNESQTVSRKYDCVCGQIGIFMIKKTMTTLLIVLITATGIIFIVLREKCFLSVIFSISLGFPFSINKIVFSTWGTTLDSAPAAYHISIKMLQTQPPTPERENHVLFISCSTVWLKWGKQSWFYFFIEQRNCRQVPNKLIFPFPNDPIKFLSLKTEEEF